jgi:Dyp-type peroxidase family
MSNLMLADIQGLILRGYNLPTVRHFILRINKAEAARRFVGSLVNGTAVGPQITSAAHWGGSKPEYCLNISFTYEGLKALALPTPSLHSFSWSRAFVTGAAARAGAIGDTGESASEYWQAPLHKPDDVHVLLSLHARGDEELTSYTRRLEDLFTRHALKNLQPYYDGRALSDGRVHFGYKDGLSQPTIAGGPEKKFSDLQPAASPGEFLLGYPSQWKGFRYPVPMPEALGVNGSFVAFRVLEQDVDAFEDYLKKTAPQIHLTPEQLAAKICGRWRNGVPLALSPETDSPQPSPISKDWLNRFDYSEDKEGYRCPFGSHLRRTNPRSDRVAGNGAHKHRIIRRGMPYGPPYNPATPNDGSKRGLLGLFICVSLDDQFEFLMANWLNEGGFSGGVPTGTKDPMVSNNTSGESKFIIPAKGKRLIIKDFPQFVTTHGGAYCFLPSITALKYIAAL